MRSWTLAICAALCLGADEPNADVPPEDDDAALLDIAAGILEDRAAAPAPTPMPGPPARPPRDNRILQLSEHQWSIAAELRDYYAPNIQALQELARPTPHRGPDGSIVGWRVRLEKYGLLHQAGFRNGDVVRAVNGRALDSWPAVLAAWKDLRKDDRFVVEVTKPDGRRLKYVYVIR